METLAVVRQVWGFWGALQDSKELGSLNLVQTYSADFLGAKLKHLNEEPSVWYPFLKLTPNSYHLKDSEQNRIRS